MLGAWRDFFAAVFLFLLHFFVVRDIAWIGHATSLIRLDRPAGGTTRRSWNRASAATRRSVRITASRRTPATAVGDLRCPPQRPVRRHSSQRH
jgi:hypothetical protein